MACVSGYQELRMIINGQDACFTEHEDVLGFISNNGYTTLSVIKSIMNCVL